MNKAYAIMVCHAKFAGIPSCRTEVHSTKEKADAAFKRLTSEIVEAYQGDICSKVVENSPYCLLIRTDYGGCGSSYVLVKNTEIQVQ